MKSYLTRLFPLALILAVAISMVTALAMWKILGTDIFSTEAIGVFIVLAVIIFCLLYAVAYRVTTMRVRRIQSIMNRIELSNTHKKQKTLTMAGLEKHLSDWFASQNKVISELQSREQFRREYMGNVSHELKTPIFNIQGYVLTLLDGAAEDPKFRKKFLKRAAKSVERMTTLVNDMDTLSKVESGQYDLIKQAVDPRKLVGEAILSVDSVARKEDATVVRKSLLPDGTKVLCDPDKILQVLNNLIINAIKYGDEKDKKVDIMLNDLGPHVQISVKDRGVGIPESDLPRIFERFYRVDKARSRDAGGSGLGLSIVKHILDRHDESITVDSIPGWGTTFHFTLRKA